MCSSIQYWYKFLEVSGWYWHTIHSMEVILDGYTDTCIIIIFGHLQDINYKLFDLESILVLGG